LTLLARRTDHRAGTVPQVSTAKLAQKTCTESLRRKQHVKAGNKATGSNRCNTAKTRACQQLPTVDSTAAEHLARQTCGIKKFATICLYLIFLLAIL
jgi:hypothetical protein